MKIKGTSNRSRLAAIENQKKTLSRAARKTKKSTNDKFDDMLFVPKKKVKMPGKKKVVHRVEKFDQAKADKEAYRSLLLEEIGLMNKMAKYKEDNKIEFFDTPNPKQALILDAWGKEQYKVFTFVGGNRSGKCATVDTLIETTKGKIPIGELYKKGNPFKVFSWNGKERVIAHANPPIKKEGLHKCYNLKMSNGEKLGLADHHRVLTSHGWSYVDQLQASFENLQGSSLEHDPSILSLNDHHLNERGIGSQESYSHGYRQYGERPQPFLSNDRSFPPLQGDVQKQICSYDLSSPFYVIGFNNIKSVSPIETFQEVYDFEVPYYKNYFSGGIVHHNTTLGTIIAISTMLGYYPWNKKKIYFPHNQPRRVRYIGQDWSKQIKSVIIPELFKWMPKNINVTRKKNNDGIDVLWTIDGGHSIEVMSNLQDPSLHEGWHGDVIVYDEPPKRQIRVANARGLVDRRGKELFCMTLLKEAWVDREVIKSVDENGRPDMSVFNVHIESYENVGYGITKEGLDQFAKALTPEEQNIRLKGVPAYMDGLVYPKYDRKIHLVERFQVPLDWIIDIAIDIHPRTEQAILFCAVSPTGIKYLVNEIWEHGDGQWVGEQIVRCIKQNDYRVGRIIIDPLAKGDSNNPNTVFEKVSLVLAQHGFYLETATKDKTAGILEVKNHLKGANNTPSLFIFSDLVRTIFEIEGYIYDKETQKPIDKDDHMCENLYRIMLLATEWNSRADEHYGNSSNNSSEDRGRNRIGGY